MFITFVVSQQLSELIIFNQQNLTITSCGPCINVPDELNQYHLCDFRFILLTLVLDEINQCRKTNSVITIFAPYPSTITDLKLT